MLVGFASVSFANSRTPLIDTFDVPSATVTYPTGINSAGQITGYYVDSTGQQHGFVRSRDGLITTFDVSDSTGTVPQAINQAGQITGYYYSEYPYCCGDGRHGFLRHRDGTIVTFDVPDATDNSLYNWHTYATIPTVINPAGDIAGYYREADIPLPGALPALTRARGFVRDRSGTITTFSPSEFDYVHIFGINPAGSLVGYFLLELGPSFALLRERDGAMTTTFSGNIALFTAINPSGQITGYSSDAPPFFGAFLLERNGSITTFKVPNSTRTYPTDIDPAGQITGYYWDTSYFYHGFLREPDGTIEIFDVTSSTNTYPMRMNTEGDITGWYSDLSGNVHGFVRTHTKWRRG
jgi:hypothetical protein